MVKKLRVAWNKGLTKETDERVKKYANTRIGLQSGEKNPNYGKTPSKKTKRKIRLSKLNEKNPMWKGDKVGYSPLHNWIRRRKPKPEFCEYCKSNPPKDLANISGEYKRDINDFEWLCRKCHMTKDGRIKKLKGGINKNGQK